MMLNSEFASRLTGSELYRVPQKKQDVSDESYVQTLRFNNFITFLDISRCQRLSPSVISSNMQLCDCVQYLDLSYTNIETLSEISMCLQRLRALSLSGCKHIISFSPISQMDMLEILSLRMSNCDSLSFLLDMRRLRSLDVGHTNINSISFLSTCVKLEELLIDGCQHIVTDSNSSQNVLSILSSLPSLRVLNAADTPFANGLKTLQSNHIFAVETISKRAQFLDAVLRDDSLLVNYLLSSGENVDTKLGPWAEQQLLNAWKINSLGDAKIQYFNCCHDDVTLRPSWLHIAIYFNAINVIDVLMENNINLSYENVWFGHIHEEESHLLANEEVTQKKTHSISHHNIYTVEEFIDLIFRNGLHRVILQMNNKRSNWRSECSLIRSKLLEKILPKLYEMVGDCEDVSIIRDIRDESETEYNKRTGHIKTSLHRLSSDTLTRKLSMTKENNSNIENPSSPTNTRTLMRSKLLPPSTRKYPWKEHALYRKLNSTPLVLRTEYFVIGSTSKDEVNIEYLGFKKQNFKSDEYLLTLKERKFETSHIKDTIAVRKKQFIKQVEERELQEIERALKMNTQANKPATARASLLSPSKKTSVSMPIPEVINNSDDDDMGYFNEM